MNNKLSPEEKVFLSLMILSIIFMIIAINFLTGAARPPKQMDDIRRRKDVPNYIIEEECYMMILRRDGIPYYLTDSDLELIKRCIMSEAGGESDEGQQAVATVIFNRYFSPKFPNSFDEIIVPGQFSVADNGEITKDVGINLQWAIIDYGTCCQSVPYNCYYFRSDHYHDFGIPFKKIGNLYFSLSEEATD